jgi:hypothetical protein
MLTTSNIILKHNIIIIIYQKEKDQHSLQRNIVVNLL